MFKWITKMFAEPTSEEIAAKESKKIEKTKKYIDKEIGRWNRNPLGRQFSVFPGQLNNREIEAVENYCGSIGWEFRFDQYTRIGTMTKPTPRPVNWGKVQ